MGGGGVLIHCVFVIYPPRVYTFDEGVPSRCIKGHCWSAAAKCFMGETHSYAAGDGDAAAAGGASNTGAEGCLADYKAKGWPGHRRTRCHHATIMRWFLPPTAPQPALHLDACSTKRDVGGAGQWQNTWKLRATDGWQLVIWDPWPCAALPTSLLVSTLSRSRPPNSPQWLATSNVNSSQKLKTGCIWKCEPARLPRPHKLLVPCRCLCEGMGVGGLP